MVLENLVDVADALAKAKMGSFSSLIVQKKGEARGRGDERKVYGDDFVHVVLITGFDYKALVRRSLDILSGVSDDGVRLSNEDVLKAIREKGLTGKDGKAVTFKEVEEARRDLVTSFVKTLEDLQPTRPTSFGPLVVDGEMVVNAKVYLGGNDTKTVREDGQVIEREVVPGTIYLSGLKIGEKVLRKAENGPIPRPNSSGLTVAKSQIRRMLPVGRYVSYMLAPGSNFVLKVGGQEAVAVVQSGLEADEIVMREVRRLLA